MLCIDNDLARPRIVKIMIYQVQNFPGPSSNKMRNVVVFDTGTSLSCVWRVPKSNPIRNKYNPFNSFSSGRFTKGTFRILIRYSLES